MTGFVDRTKATFSFVDSTRVLTLTPVNSTDCKVFYRGKEYTIDTAKSITLSNASGGRYITYNVDTGALVEGTIGVNASITTDLLVSYVYYDAQASRNKAIIVGDERHGHSRDTQWHLSQHLDVGSVWRSGGALTYTLNDDTNVAIEVGSPITFADEDIVHTVTHSNNPNGYYEQTLIGAAVIPAMYKLNQHWVETDGDSTPWLMGTTRAAYNQITGGAGQLTDVPNNYYVTYWLCATNDMRKPVKVVLGNMAWASAADAYNDEFDTTGIPLPEIVPMYKIVLHVNDSYTNNTEHVVIQQVFTLTSRQTSMSLRAFSPVSHDNLTDREIANQHPISAIVNLQSSLDAKQATLVSGTNIKTINSTSILGSGNIAVSDTNTTYSIAASTTTGGANLDLTAGGSGSGTDTVKFAQSKFATVTQTDVNTITIGTTYNITVGTTAPTSPNVGDLWVDTN